MTTHPSQLKIRYAPSNTDRRSSLMLPCGDDTHVRISCIAYAAMWRPWLGSKYNPITNNGVGHRAGEFANCVREMRTMTPHLEDLQGMTCESARLIDEWLTRYELSCSKFAVAEKIKTERAPQRDALAKEAMVALIHAHCIKDPTEVAIAAYAIADAMIQAR